MTDPTPVAFFNEAARETDWVLVFCQACGELLGVRDQIRIRAEHFEQRGHRGMEFVRVAQVAVGAAALKALPERSKAILALAELSDEELVERVARWTLERVEGDDWSEAPRGRQGVYREEAALLLTALGLPVVEREATG